jgi:hypothetical protein
LAETAGLLALGVFLTVVAAVSLALAVVAAAAIDERRVGQGF